MPSMIWQVLGLDLNRSESTGTLARAIPWGRLNVVEKEKLRLDVFGRRRHRRESPTFLKDKSRADQSMTPALGASTPETKGSRWLSFPPLCSARGWDCASSSGFPIGNLSSL